MQIEMLDNECEIMLLFKGATAVDFVHLLNCHSSGFEVLLCVMVSCSKKTNCVSIE